MLQKSNVAVEDNPSLYERLGGKTAIAAAVEEFYVRVLADPELRPFFAKTNMKWLKTRQAQFLTQALGGENARRDCDFARLTILSAISSLPTGLLGTQPAASYSRSSQSCAAATSMPPTSVSESS